MEADGNGKQASPPLSFPVSAPNNTYNILALFNISSFCCSSFFLALIVHGKAELICKTLISSPLSFRAERGILAEADISGPLEAVSHWSK
jgi:hypothetical protein